MRSSTVCSSLLPPGRTTGAGVEHVVTGLEQRHFTADGLDHTSHVPAEHLGGAVSGATFWRTLVSTGLTEMALTSTSRSRGPATGSGSSMSCRDFGW